ncbi:MAG: hypothetical protein Q4A89_01800 [Tannerella sp.]|nr:hypothetical protein [Tannerella sp.]
MYHQQARKGAAKIVETSNMQTRRDRDVKHITLKLPQTKLSSEKGSAANSLPETDSDKISSESCMKQETRISKSETSRKEN